VELIERTKEHMLLKNESMASLIEDLLESGLDEDQHFRNYEFLINELNSQDIIDTVTDIDKLDRLMSEIRPIITNCLLQVAKDYESKK